MSCFHVNIVLYLDVTAVVGRKRYDVTVATDTVALSKPNPV